MQRFAGEPWRIRSDWAAGRVRADGTQEATGVIVLAVLWNAISAPIFWVVPRELKRGNPAALLAALFPLVGAGLAFHAVERWRRWKRLRRSVLALDTLPGRPGARLRGRIETTLPVPAQEPLQLSLYCGRRRRLGRRGGWNEDLLERSDVTLPPGAISRLGETVSIPVEIEIPTGGLPSTPGGPPERILWRLDAKAGQAYEASFEVPIFAATGS
jgi:hypothetical protein